MYSRDAGDLQSFEIGALHDLVLSRENITNVTVSDDQMRPGLFFLRSATLQAMRPNTSLERTRDK
jgi:hypothetical protein